jgi:hypothetical protein
MWASQRYQPVVLLVGRGLCLFGAPDDHTIGHDEYLAPIDERWVTGFVAAQGRLDVGIGAIFADEILQPVDAALDQVRGTMLVSVFRQQYHALVFEPAGVDLLKFLPEPLEDFEIRRLEIHLIGFHELDYFPEICSSKFLLLAKLHQN